MGTSGGVYSFSLFSQRGRGWRRSFKGADGGSRLRCGAAFASGHLGENRGTFFVGQKSVISKHTQKNWNTVRKIWKCGWISVGRRLRTERMKK